MNKIGLRSKGDNLIESHVSQDGRYILDCNDGLKIHEFKIEKRGDEDRIVMEERKLQLPIRTEGIGHVELAKRVRFESNNVIRILTQENQDVLLELLDDDKVR